MENFVEVLEKSAVKYNSIACMGMDPVVERIPIREKNIEKKIVKFYKEIIAASSSSGSMPSAVKPNYAFFAQYGFPGLRALRKVIDLSKKAGYTVILDAKRGDIGSSSEAYAREVFDFWKADAVTVSPFMGRDSVEPFISRCKNGIGVYLLVRTSNKGAADFQSGLFISVAKKLIEWHVEGVGAVVSALDVPELEKINSVFINSGKQIPLLIPGVGSQGGSAKEVCSELRKGGNFLIHRINSSSAINYAYEKNNDSDFADAAAKALSALNREIGKL